MYFGTQKPTSDSKRNSVEIATEAAPKLPTIPQRALQFLRRPSVLSTSRSRRGSGSRNRSRNRNRLDDEEAQSVGVDAEFHAPSLSHVVSSSPFRVSLPVAEADAGAVDAGLDDQDVPAQGQVPRSPSRARPEAEDDAGSVGTRSGIDDDLDSESDSEGERDGEGGGGIFISEAYSEDFSPSSSLVNVSIPGSIMSSRESRDDLASSTANCEAETRQDMVLPPLSPLPAFLPLPSRRASVPAAAEPSRIRPRNFYPPPPVNPIPYQPPLYSHSSPSSSSPYSHTPISISPHSHSHSRPLQSLASAPTSTSRPLEAVQPRSSYSTPASPLQVPPSLAAYPPPLAPAPISTSSEIHPHPYPSTSLSPKYGPSSVTAPSPLTVPRFEFDWLPTKPPPENLMGDRLDIPMFTPLTSIQTCALAVRMHWEVVSEFFLSFPFVLWSFCVL